MEATKFTEVGYVGRDVEQIVRDLLEAAIILVKEGKRKDVQAKAHLQAEERVLDALVGPASSRRRATASAASCGRTNSTTRRSRSRSPPPAAARPPSRSPACRRHGGRDEPFGHDVEDDGRPGKKTRRTSVKDAYEPLIQEESEKLLDQDQVVQEAIRVVENNGIVFLTRSTRSAPARPDGRRPSRARACSATCCR